MPALDDNYAFKIIDPKHGEFRVYADGRTAGFSPGSTIVNRIPELLEDANREGWRSGARDY